MTPPGVPPLPLRRRPEEEGPSLLLSVWFACLGPSAGRPGSGGPRPPGPPGLGQRNRTPSIPVTGTYSWRPRCRQGGLKTPAAALLPPPVPAGAAGAGVRTVRAPVLCVLGRGLQNGLVPLSVPPQTRSFLVAHLLPSARRKERKHDS